MFPPKDHKNTIDTQKGECSGKFCQDCQRVLGMLHRKFFVGDYAPSTVMDSYQVNHPPKEEESELTHSGLASLDSLLPPHNSLLVLCVLLSLHLHNFAFFCQLTSVSLSILKFLYISHSQEYAFCSGLNEKRYLIGSCF